MTDREIMQQALEMIEDARNGSQRKPSEPVITALRERLAQPEQEPVWIQPNHLQLARRAPFLCRVEPKQRDDFVPLYTATQPEQEPVAWLGFNPRSGTPEFSTDKPSPSVLRDFKMRPLEYADTAPPQPAPQPEPMTEFDEAVAAVDATLHHAVDYWQERALKAEARLAQPEQEPVSMRLPKAGDKVICLEDESLATVVSLTAGGSPDIVFSDGSRGTYLLKEFAELFGYATGHGDTMEGLLQEFEREIGFDRAELWLKRINEAVLAEREACAKVCDELFADVPPYSAPDCAAAIRART